MSRFITNAVRRSLLDVEPDPDESLLESSLRDIYRAPAAGVVRFGQGLGDLIDTAGEFLGADLVDDWYWQEERLKDLGIQTRTIAGGFGRGLVQNALAFVPVVGAMGRLGLLAKAGQVGSGLARAAGLAESFGAAAGRYGASSVLGGAIADFVSQQGNEGRLADLAANLGGSTILTRWLETDEDDPWLEARLKNVMEGALIGPIADVGLSGLRKALMPSLKAAKLASKGKTDQIPDLIAREVEAGNLDPKILDTLGDPQNASTGSTMPQDAFQASQATEGASKGSNASEGLVDEMVGSSIFTNLRGPEDVRSEIQSGYMPLESFREVDQTKFNEEMIRDIGKAMQAGHGLGDALAGHVVNRIRYSKFKTAEDAATAMWGMSEYLKTKGVTEGPDAVGPKRTIEEMTREGSLLHQTLGNEGMIAYVNSKQDDYQSLAAEVVAINATLKGAAENFADVSMKNKIKKDLGTYGDTDEAEFYYALQVLHNSTVAAKSLTRPLGQAVVVQRGDVIDVPKSAAAEAATKVIKKEQRRLEDLKQAAKEASLKGNEDLRLIVDGLARLQEKQLEKVTKAKKPGTEGASKGTPKAPSGGRKGLDPRSYKDVDGQTLFDFMLGPDPADNLQLKQVPTGQKPTVELRMSEPSKPKDPNKPRTVEYVTLPKPDKLVDAVDAAISQNQAPRYMELLAKAARVGDKALRVTLEFYKASILSGIPTFGINGISGITNLGLQTLARTIGAGTDALRGRGTKELNDSLSLGMSVIGSAFDMVRLASLDTTESGFKGFGSVWRAITTENPQITGNTGLEITRAINLPDKPWYHPVNIAGRVVRAPFTVNQAFDESVKTIAYLGHVRAKAISEANDMIANDLPQVMAILGRDPKQGLTGAEKEAFKVMWMEFKQKMSFDTHGRAQGAINREEGLYDTEAMSFAESVGYSRDLEYGLGKTIQDTVGKHPALGFVLPFVKTPTLIFRQFVNMTPGLGQLQYAYQKRIGYLSESQALQAKGEMVIGGAIWAASGYLAMTGQVTGGGPSSKAEREVLLASGWRPYSFVITNEQGEKEYIEYRRFDPISMVMGLAADYQQARAYMDEDSASEVAMAMSLAMANNVTNKTYFTGLTELLKAVTSPDVSMKGYLQNRIASLVPNFFARASSAEDDYLREARSVLDAVKRRIPELSEDLPVKRNILGEPVTPPSGYLPFTDTLSPGMAQRISRMVSPAAFSKEVDDPVKQEIARLSYGFSLPSKDFGGVDLTKVRIKGREGYDYYQEKVGKIRINGQTLAQALSKKIKSSSYQSLPTPMDRNDEDNPRVRAIRATIQRYREKAKRDLLRESPELRRAIKALERASTAGQHKAPILQSLEDL